MPDIEESKLDRSGLTSKKEIISKEEFASEISLDKKKKEKIWQQLLIYK